MIVDGGMVTMEVVAMAGPDVTCSVLDPGLILSRANLTFRDHQGNLIRGKNANLPVITAKVLALHPFFCTVLEKGI